VVRPEARAAWYILLPDNMYKTAWDVLVVVSLLYTLVVAPVQLAFDSFQDDDAIEWCVDIIFLLDVFVSFITAYYDKEALGYEIRFTKIAHHYTITWLVPDLLAAFPWQVLQDGTAQAIKSARIVPKWTRVIKVVRLLRLWRVYRLVRMGKEKANTMGPALSRMMGLTCVLLFFSHISACLWYYTGNTEDGWVSRMWDAGERLEERPLSEQYLICFYWSVTVLTTIGFGDITPRTNSEVGLVIIMMIFGCTYYAYLTAVVTSMIATLDAQSKLLRQKQRALATFMSSVGLAPALREQLLVCMRFIWKQPEHLDWKHTLEQLPMGLQQDVVQDLYRGLMKHNNFLKCLAGFPSAVHNILCALDPVSFQANFLLARSNTAVDAIYFVDQGEVAVIVNSYRSGKSYRFATMTTGSCFGELCAIEGTDWLFDYRSVSDVRLFKISFEQVMSVLKETDRSDSVRLHSTLQTYVDTKVRWYREALTKQELGEKRFSADIGGGVLDTLAAMMETAAVSLASPVSSTSEHTRSSAGVASVSSEEAVSKTIRGSGRQSVDLNSSQNKVSLKHWQKTALQGESNSSLDRRITGLEEKQEEMLQMMGRLLASITELQGPDQVES